jgi:beta-1,4-N-acetylglucosaminyltransferase
MIFLTVGTQFPFNRLIKAVDEAIGNNHLNDKIIAQIGVTTYRPKNFEAIPSLEKKLFDQYFNEAGSIISHAGVGSITLSLERRKPMLVMPRLKKYGEVVNDHQLAIAKKFEDLGYLLAAYDAADIPAKIEQLKSFVPQARQSQAKLVADRISVFLNEFSGMKSKLVKG